MFIIPAPRKRRQEIKAKWVSIVRGTATDWQIGQKKTVSLQPWIWSERSCGENRAQKLVTSLLSLPSSASQGSLLELPAGGTNRPPEISFFGAQLFSLTGWLSYHKAPALGSALQTALPIASSSFLGCSGFPCLLFLLLSNHCEDCCCATVAHGVAFADLLSLKLLCSSTVWKDPCYFSEHVLQPLTLLRVVILGRSPESRWTIYDPKSFRCSQLDVCLWGEIINSRFTNNALN